MNIVLVHNPHSGTALSLSELRTLFAQHDIAISHAIDITSNFDTEIQSHLHDDTLIAAYGGDGTQNAVAQHVYGTHTTMIPLPGGTLNNFTKDLGIPQELDDALARLHSCKPRSIDVGTVNNRVFVNNSSIGFYPSSLRVREAVDSKIGKWPAALLGVIHALIKFKLYTVTLNNETFRTPFVFIGNNEYPLTSGGRRPSLTSGTLCIYTIAASNKRTLLKLIFSALRGQLAEQDEFITFHTSEVTIHTRRARVTVSTDGEVTRLDTPLTYHSQHAQLKILG